MTILQQLSLFRDAPAAPSTSAALLRPYQEAAIDALEAYWGGGGKRALIALPTGTGKTVMFAAVLRRNLRGRRGLVIAHREELLDQGAATIARSGLSAGIEQADRHAGNVDVVVASIQTLTASGGRRLQQMPRRDFGVVVIDESHHASARTYMAMLHHFGLGPDPERFFSKQGRRAAIDGFAAAADAPLLLGVTATPSRSDKVGLEVAFDEIVYSRSIREMIEESWLCPVRGVRVLTDTSIDAVPVNHGDFADRALEQTVNNQQRNELIVAAFHDHAPGRQAIGFAAGVAHAEALADAFRAAGVPSDWVSGAHDRFERHHVIEAYKRGDLRVIWNVAVLTEGFDHPATSCIIMARPTKSSTVYTQAIGRGTRLADGKPDMVVIDVVDAYQHAGLATAAALFGLPPKFVSDPEGKEPLHQTAMRFDAEIEQCRVPSSLLGDATSWADIKRIAQDVDPLQVAAMDPVLKDCARLAWLTASWGYYLGVPGGSVGVVVNLLGQATVRLKERDKPPTTLVQLPNAPDAVRWAEEWVTRERGEAAGLLDLRAKWRKGGASPAQLQFARRLGIVVPEGATKGHVSALIDQRLNGRMK